MAGTTSEERLAVTLVTGFLGAGKTTLINAVLRSTAFANAMVVVNEFGEVGLDHLLVEGGDDKVVLLDSGCLCCAVSGSLRDTMIDLFMRRASGAIPSFDRVIVETSGLANPVPLIASVVADSAVARHFRLGLVLTVVDALYGADTLARYEEAVRQVAVADRILISKTESSDPAAVAALRGRLAETNESAEIGTWQRGGDPAAHFAQRRDGLAPAAEALVPFSQGRFNKEAAGGVRASTHGTAFGRVRAHVLRVPGVADWAEYAQWTDCMRRAFGRRLLRCKGIVAIGDAGALWVVQAVQGHFTPPERLPAAREAALGESERGFLVCIGEGISREQLQDTLPLLNGANERQELSMEHR
jgi:G3E family GTPase